ncbi:hypothetical protein [Streptomyces altiplanensis]
MAQRTRRATGQGDRRQPASPRRSRRTAERGRLRRTAARTPARGAVRVVPPARRTGRRLPCRLCGKSQASAWDHCHEHGHVRGRCAAAATPARARPRRTASSRSKAAHCTSWSAAVLQTLEVVSPG